MKELAAYPPVDRWNDWVEYDPKSWPKKREVHYMLVPTVCFNCEAACGLLGYVNKETLQIAKFQGNPFHPGSRGRNCAKGPATINQVYDPERILYPLKRVGKRGEGGWERITWDQALDEIAARMRECIKQGRNKDFIFNYMGNELDRLLRVFGGGKFERTNVCSSSARAGYSFWMGSDWPSVDYSNAKFILLVSATMESGHFLNPHSQRIMEARMNGAKIAVVDPRLSNTAAKADYWLAAWPGTESIVFLAMANVLLQENLFNADFLRRWTNWEEYLKAVHQSVPCTFEAFVSKIKDAYSKYTPEYAESESGIPRETLIEVAHKIADAGTAFSSYIWRGPAAGNLGGWQTVRSLFFLQVLTGSVGSEGGVSPGDWHSFFFEPFGSPPIQNLWNELLYPIEFPLSHHEMGFLLPYFLKDRRGSVSVYFSRASNPVWSFPDGLSWMDVMRDEAEVELHVALTPTWSETAFLADYVLPMGVAAEKHELESRATHTSTWMSFRQPVLRVAEERMGREVKFTYEVNPGEVWEEDEFWIELAWRVDQDGELGVRKYFESPYRPGQKMSVTEYYRWVFEECTPGLKETAASEGLTPFTFMRKYGAFEIKSQVYRIHEKEIWPDQLRNAQVDPKSKLIKTKSSGQGVVLEDSASAERVIGVEVDGKAYVGFPTPSRKLEFFSKTLADWGWPEYAIPTYIRSHVAKDDIDPKKGEFLLIPNFRVPTLIHSRSGNAKLLYELSNRNPIWLHVNDATRLGLTTGDLVKVWTEIGYFVNSVWVTEGIRPGIVACSHHFGRWRLREDSGGERWSSSLMEFHDLGNGRRFVRRVKGIHPFSSKDHDSERVWWQEGGVPQNLAYAPHPDPVSGQNCWHQKVRIEKAGEGDKFGDIYVDTTKSYEVYRRWLSKAKPGPGPGNLRRPVWLPWGHGSSKPQVEAYQYRSSNKCPPSEV